jgi:hypothetical protein
MTKSLADAAARTSPETWRIALGRGVSSALVAVFCYATMSRVPSLREPYWAPIAAVVVLYPEREATKKAAASACITPARARVGPAAPRHPDRRSGRGHGRVGRIDGCG